jgi:hypothetical protein
LFSKLLSIYPLLIHSCSGYLWSTNDKTGPVLIAEEVKVTEINPCPRAAHNSMGKR